VAIPVAKKPTMLRPRTGRNRPVPVGKVLAGDWGFADGQIKVAGRGADVTEDAQTDAAYSSAHASIGKGRLPAHTFKARR
jgi:hypothetical protein